MNPFKCRHCDKPAHFYFREGGMLCVDHAEAFCLAQAQDMMQRSRLDKSSSCGDVKESSASIPEYNGVKSPALLTAHGLSGKSCPLSRIVSGPQDSIPLPRFIPPEAGAPVVTPLPVTAGAALSESPGEVDRAAVVHSSVVERCAAADVGFPDLRYATTFRVTADNSIQESM